MALIFGGPIFWGLATALLGGLLGKTADLGLDNKFMKAVGDSLEPGQSALSLPVAKVTPDKVLPHLEKFGGDVPQTSLSKEDEEKLRQALEHPEVTKAAEEAIAPDEA